MTETIETDNNNNEEPLLLEGITETPSQRTKNFNSIVDLGNYLTLVRPVGVLVQTGRNVDGGIFYQLTTEDNNNN